jgi:hypothetical protein
MRHAARSSRRMQDAQRAACSGSAAIQAAVAAGRRTSLRTERVTPRQPNQTNTPTPPHTPAPNKAKDGKKAKKFQLGVFEAKLGSAIQEATGAPCVCNELVGEVLRGCRLHFTRFIGDLKEPDLKRAQLGLAHSYSRAKVRRLGGGGLWFGLRGWGGVALRHQACMSRVMQAAVPLRYIAN